MTGEVTSTWVVLLHRAANGQGAAVFADDRFGAHVEFLNRLRDQGYLVAAGPLPDEDGAGMTILRLPGADRVADAELLARTDDGAVTGGLFTVDVRPWNVVMAP